MFHAYCLKILYLQKIFQISVAVVLDFYYASELGYLLKCTFLDSCPRDSDSLQNQLTVVPRNLYFGQVA